jgi:hypothetical protein
MNARHGTKEPLYFLQMQGFLQASGYVNSHRLRFRLLAREENQR